MFEKNFNKKVSVSETNRRIEEVVINTPLPELTETPMFRQELASSFPAFPIIPIMAMILVRKIFSPKDNKQNQSIVSDFKIADNSHLHKVLQNHSNEYHLRGIKRVSG
jgi:hypothetical protein